MPYKQPGHQFNNCQARKNRYSPSSNNSNNYSRINRNNMKANSDTINERGDEESEGNVKY